MPAGAGGSGLGPTGPPTKILGNPATFTAAANTQASDYDTIMQNYQKIINNPGGGVGGSSNPAAPVVPQFQKYNQSGDVTKSLMDLEGLADTGGYSPQGIADIRARDIAPTRSIYANAQQNVDRQRALGGGYSPNFNAAQASMARDESSKISDVTTAANAGIAQNVASNRIGASGTYAGAAASANAAKTAVDTHNADIVNQINSGNADRQARSTEFGTDARLRATQGQGTLYGTTPALTSLFGNQVFQAGQQGQTQEQIDSQRQKNLFGAGGSTPLYNG